MTDQQEREAFTEWYESTDFFKSNRLRLDDKETRRAVLRNVWEQALVSSPPVLPAELKAGHMRFAAGVSLSTVAKYIERLQKYLHELKPMDPEKSQQLRALLDGIQRRNEEFEKGGDANGPDSASSNAQPGAAHPVNTPFIKDAAFFEAQRAIAASFARATIPQGMRMVPTRVSISGMYDMHLFHSIPGATVEEVIANWLKHNEEPDEYGKSYLCPAIVLSGDKELRRVGKMVFQDRLEELDAYKEALLADPDISRLLAAAPQQPDEGGT
jgi:hypothetical protein